MSHANTGTSPDTLQKLHKETVNEQTKAHHRVLGGVEISDAMLEQQALKNRVQGNNVPPALQQVRQLAESGKQKDRQKAAELVKGIENVRGRSVVIGSNMGMDQTTEFSTPNLQPRYSIQDQFGYDKQMELERKQKLKEETALVGVFAAGGDGLTKPGQMPPGMMDKTSSTGSTQPSYHPRQDEYDKNGNLIVDPRLQRRPPHSGGDPQSSQQVYFQQQQGGPGQDRGPLAVLSSQQLQQQQQGQGSQGLGPNMNQQQQQLHPTEANRFRDQYLRGSIFSTDDHEVVIPEANEIIRNRYFTLEGLSLEQQLEEMQRIKKKVKKQEDQLKRENKEFRDKCKDQKIYDYTAHRFGQYPLGLQLQQKPMKMEDLGYFGSEEAPLEVVSIEAPLWLKALLELSGVTSLRAYITEDKQRRSESDYIHSFPGVHNTVKSFTFELIATLGIMLNTFMLIMQLNQTDRYANEGFYDFMDKFFTLLFTFEWFVRVVAFGWTNLFDRHNVFDTLLIIGFGFLPQFILPMLGFSIDSASLRSFTALRTLRVVRLAKAVRTRPGLSEMWEIINGFMSSAPTVAWTLVLTTILVFCFGVMGIKCFMHSSAHQKSYHDKEFVRQYFGNLSNSMLSMFQVLTLDMYSEEIVRPLTLPNLKNENSFGLPVAANENMDAHGDNGHSSDSISTQSSTTTPDPNGNVLGDNMGDVNSNMSMMNGVSNDPSSRLLAMITENPNPAINEDSTTLVFFTRMFFIFYITISVYIVMNTVLALLVEQVFSGAKQDEVLNSKQLQQKKEDELNMLTELFLDIDADKSGDLTKTEFYNALEFNEHIRNRLVELDLSPEFLKSTWSILDDGDGLLTVFEFTSGIRNLRGEAKTRDVMDAQKRLEQSKNFIEEFLEPAIMKFDRVLYVLQRDLVDIMNDTALISDAMESLVDMVGDFFRRAKQTKKDLNEEVKNAQRAMYRLKQEEKEEKIKMRQSVRGLTPNGLVPLEKNSPKK